MRIVISLALLTLAPAWALAATPERFYYVGEVKISSASGQAIGSEVYLVEKVHDRDNATIVESAVVVKPDGKADEYIMRLTVKDDGTFTLSNDDKTVEGTGTLFGPAWQWTYFKATYRTKDGTQIDDENFMADPSAGTARKKVTAPDGKVVMYMDMTLKSVTPKTFEILRAGVMRK